MTRIVNTIMYRRLYYNSCNLKTCKNYFSTTSSISSKSESATRRRKISRYKDTLLLPSTNFLRSQKGLKRKEHEIRMLKVKTIKYRVDTKWGALLLKTVLFFSLCYSLIIAKLRIPILKISFSVWYIFNQLYNALYM